MLEGSWINGDQADAYVENGYLVYPGNVLTWKLSGDIEGYYVMTVSFIFALDGSMDLVTGEGDYYFKGKAVFDGKVIGERVNWVTDVQGGGHESAWPALGGQGQESWDSTILLATPCVSGSITFTGNFDFATSTFDYSYSGTLHGDCSAKEK
jgi:hypothetical protein